MAKKRLSIVRPGRRADVSCAVCGRPLTLWDTTAALDGHTVCASNCLGQAILRARQRPEYQEQAPPAPGPEACGSGSRPTFLNDQSSPAGCLEAPGRSQEDAK